MNKTVIIRRKLLILAACLVAGTAIAATSYFRRPPLNDRWLQFDAPIHDFGSVIPGETLRHDFQFKNTSRETLRILDVSTSCGCTAAEMSQRVFESGETGTVSVTFRLPPHPDPVSHSVTVVSNDPSSPETRLIIVADPEWPVATTPEAIHFPPIPEGSLLERRLEVFTPSGKSFQVTEIKSTTPSIQIRELERVDRRRLYEVEVKIEKPGGFREWIEIHTDVAGRELIRIPIDGTVGALEKVSPSRLILGQRTPVEAVTRRLVITDAALAEVHAVTVDKPQSWSILNWTMNSPKSIELRLQVPGSDGYHSCTVEVSFAGGATLLIPVSCIVKQQDGGVEDLKVKVGD